MKQEELARRLHSAAVRLVRRVRAADLESGMSPARLSVLSILVFGGPRTVTQLARAEQVAQPTMSKLVAALAGEGMLRLVPDPSDGRARLARATPRGKRVLERARERREAALDDVLSGLDAARRRVLAQASEILLACLRDSEET